jgi:hypothetical protein
MKEIEELTLMVNLLYENDAGMRLKKSSYWSSATALSATYASSGLIAGGNLPLFSKFSRLDIVSDNT